eukprot:4655267-Karenia_brevis.AAC.1
MQPSPLEGMLSTLRQQRELDGNTPWGCGDGRFPLAEKKVEEAIKVVGCFKDKANIWDAEHNTEIPVDPHFPARVPLHHPCTTLPEIHILTNHAVWVALNILCCISDII